MLKIQLDTPTVNEIRSSNWRRRRRSRHCSCPRQSLSPFSRGLPFHRRATFRQQRRVTPPEKPRVHAVPDESAKSTEVFELHDAVPGEHLLQAGVRKLERLSQGRHPCRGGAWHVQLSNPVGDAVLKVGCIQSREVHGRQALLAHPLDERLPSEFERVARELARGVSRVRHASDSIFWHLSEPKDQ